MRNSWIQPVISDKAWWKRQLYSYSGIDRQTSKNKYRASWKHSLVEWPISERIHNKQKLRVISIYYFLRPSKLQNWYYPIERGGTLEVTDIGLLPAKCVQLEIKCKICLRKTNKTTCFISLPCFMRRWYSLPSAQKNEQSVLYALGVVASHIVDWQPLIYLILFPKS